MNKKRETNIHYQTSPSSRISPKKKRKVKSSRSSTYASSCEYLPKQSKASYLLKEVRAGQLGGINGTTANESIKNTLRSPMKGSHFSSYRVGPFVNQRNGGTKSRIWYHSRA